MKKSVMLMAGILAVALAGSAQAAGNTMFAVQDTTGTIDKAVITDTGDIVTVGTVTAPKIGVGTSAPVASLHSAETGTSATRGIMAAQHNDGAQGGNILFRKSRGTEVAPTQPVASDYIGLFTAQFWDGTQYARGGQFGFRNDAPVSAGLFPTAVMFYTGDTTVNLKEGLRITSTQNVVTGNLAGTATGDMATNATNGFLYIPSVAGALTTCATATVITGHVPVWFDTTNSKICTCQGSALKCTAALL